MCGLNLVGDVAFYLGSRFGHGGEIAADGGSGGEAGLVRDGFVVGVFGVHLYNDLCVPEAGLDGDVGELGGEAGDAEDEDGGGAEGGGFMRVHLGAPGVECEWAREKVSMVGW